MSQNDRRWRGALPQPVPEGMTTVSRVQAARLAGVDPRTISRWAADGILVKYRGPRGAVQFDKSAVMRLRKEPDDRQARPERHKSEQRPSPPRPRW